MRILMKHKWMIGQAKYRRSPERSRRAAILALCVAGTVAWSTLAALEELVLIESRFTVIDRHQLGDLGIDEFEDIINRLPNYPGRSALPGADGDASTSQVTIRGLGDNRIPFLINGRQIFTGRGAVDGSMDFLNDLELAAMTERVEILRGSQGTLFGENNSGGIVNLVTRNGADTYQIGQSNSYYDLYDQLNRKLMFSTQDMNYCNATSGVFQPFWSLGGGVGPVVGPFVDDDTWYYGSWTAGLKGGGFGGAGGTADEKVELDLRDGSQFDFGSFYEDDDGFEFTRDELWRLHAGLPGTRVDKIDYSWLMKGGPDDPDDYGGYFMFGWISMTREEREEFDRWAEEVFPDLGRANGSSDPEISVPDASSSGEGTTPPAATGGGGETVTPDPAAPAEDADTDGVEERIDPDSLPEPFTGFAYPPDYLLGDPNECTEKQKSTALGYMRARNQGRADHSHWSDLMMNPYLDARTRDEYAQNATDALAVRNQNNEKLKKLLLKCVKKGDKPVTGTSGKTTTETTPTETTPTETTPGSGATSGTPRRAQRIEIEVLRVTADEPAPDTDRRARVRYDSPTFAGFTLSQSWGEPVDDYAITLRYANEFGAFRIAAAAPNPDSRDTETGASEGAPIVFTNNLGLATIDFPEWLFINIPGLNEPPVAPVVEETELKFKWNMGIEFDTGTIKIRVPYDPIDSENIEFEGRGAGINSLNDLDADFWDDYASGSDGLRDADFWYDYASGSGGSLVDAFGINGNLNLVVERPEREPLNADAFSGMQGYQGYENNQCGDKAAATLNATTLSALMAAQLASAGQGPDDPQWAFERVGFTKTDPAWDLVSPGAGPIVVGLIDTGIDWDHLDLSFDNLWQNAGEIPENGIDDDGNGYIDDIIGWNFVNFDNRPWDNDGHGTFVAGLIAADGNNGTGIRGINPDAKIMVLKALNNFGRTRASYVARAIVYGVDNGAQILNLSLTGQGLPRVVQQAIEYANQNGVLVVVAAGNTGGSTDNVYSAGQDNVLAVAATGQDDRRAEFSNAGDNISVSAPGIDIQSLRARLTDFMYNSNDTPYQKGSGFVGTENRYYRSAGTSFSTAIVSGVASLVWSDNPSLAHTQVRRILEQTARDVEVPGLDRFTGYGVVDAKAALGADPDFFVVAKVDTMVQRGSGSSSYAEVTGTADADQFARAWLEIGAGEFPTSWKRIGGELSAPVVSGVIGRIPGSELEGQATWTVRLVVAHQNDQQRENRFTVSVSGTP